MTTDPFLELRIRDDTGEGDAPWDGKTMGENLADVELRDAEGAVPCSMWRDAFEAERRDAAMRRST